MEEQFKGDVPQLRGMEGYMTDPEERKDDSSDRVWYYGGWYEKSQRYKHLSWLASNGEEQHYFESPADAKFWIKKTRDETHKK